MVPGKRTSGHAFPEVDAIEIPGDDRNVGDLAFELGS
jgi:hypothetical protein